MVAGASTAHFWVYAEGEGMLITVRRDEEMMSLIREGWDDFQQYLDTDSPPPLTEADSAQRADAAWAEAAKAYLEAKLAADIADATLEAARKALVGLLRHPWADTKHGGSLRCIPHRLTIRMPLGAALNKFEYGAHHAASFLFLDCSRLRMIRLTTRIRMRMDWRPVSPVAAARNIQRRDLSPLAGRRTTRPAGFCRGSSCRHRCSQPAA
jgi:hypothetical protein